MGAGGALRFFLSGISRTLPHVRPTSFRAAPRLPTCFPHHDLHLHLGSCLNLPSWRLSSGCVLVCVLVQQPYHYKTIATTSQSIRQVTHLPATFHYEQHTHYIPAAL
eukprot:1302152-Amphidinium_carterae.1